MKTLHVVIASLLLGAGMGAAVSWASFANPPQFRLPGKYPIRPRAATEPRADVDLRHFDFGAVEAGSKASHVFHVTNVGHGTLTLEGAGTSCGQCTIAELDKTSLAPGETAAVTVDYLPAATATPTFRQIAWLSTNDPHQSRIELVVSGTIRVKYRLIPDGFKLTRVSADSTTRAEVKLLTYIAGKIEFVGFQPAEAETAEFFEVNAEPLPRDQFGDAEARGGLRLVLSVKPGLPLGQIRQTIRLEMRLGDAEETSKIDVVVDGIVTGDISIAGAGWNSGKSRLSFGDVPSAKGATRRVLLLVHGEHRQDARFEVKSADPTWLKASLGEPAELNQSVTQIPLTVEIPPGQPPQNHSGSEQGKYAELVLKVDNMPQIKELRLYVQFVIE